MLCCDVVWCCEVSCAVMRSAGGGGWKRWGEVRLSEVF